MSASSSLSATQGIMTMAVLIVSSFLLLLGLMIHLPAPADSFAPLSLTSVPSSSQLQRVRVVIAPDEESSLRLYGVRRRLSQSLSRWRRTTNKNDDSSSSSSASSSSPFLQEMNTENATVATALVVDVPEDQAQESRAETETETETATMTLVQEEAARSTSLYSLPPVPVDQKLSTLELEFRAMLEHFTNYSEHDILSLKDPRLRTLIEGIAASADDYPVYRAFEVLFEDLYPLRVAGRVIYKRLVQFMEKSNQERHDQVQAVVEQTGLSAQDVDAARLLFVSAAAELNHGPYITIEQLQTTGLMETARHVLTYESDERLLQLMMEQRNNDPSKDSKSNEKKGQRRAGAAAAGKIQFSDFILGLTQAAQEQCAIEVCDPLDTVHQVVNDLQQNPPDTTPQTVDARRERFSHRYDEMLEAFSKWEDLLPPSSSDNGSGSEPATAASHGEGRGLAATSRRLDVIRGCFVGAKNEKVVEALRICYVDYSGLRLAAELIFKLVSTFMNARMASRRSRQ